MTGRAFAPSRDTTPARNRRRFSSVTAEGLRFMRNGVAETAVHTDGDATGLKYLAGKQDCLTVKPGEGYCRD